MAFKPRFDNNSTDNSASTDQIWQNSIGYLQLLHELDVEINKAFAIGDLVSCIQYQSQLLILLERIIKKKEVNGRSQEYNKLMPLIEAAQIKIIQTSSDATVIRQALYKDIRETYLQLGDIMYNLNLVFKQGIDSIDWWAEG